MNELDLATRVAAMTERKVPLGEGFRALAEDAEGRSQRRLYLRLAERIEQGMEPSEALASLSIRRFKPIAAMLEVLPDATTQAEVLMIWEASTSRFRAESRRFRLLLAYPVVVLLLATGASLWLLKTVGVATIQVTQGWGVDVSATTSMIYWLIEIPAWSYPLALATAILLLVIGALAIPRRDRQRLTLLLPLYGPLLTWHLWSTVFRLAASLVAARVPLVDLFRGLEKQFYHTILRIPLHQIAAALTRGDSLAEAFGAARGAPAEFAAFFERVDSPEEMEQTLEALAHVTHDRWRMQATLLRRIIPAVILLLAGGVIATAIGSLFTFMRLYLRLFFGL